MKKSGLPVFTIILIIQGLNAQTSPCDLNRDGSVNIVDVQGMINEALGVAACTNDLDGSGKCDIVDVQRVITSALGGVCTTSTAQPVTVTLPIPSGTIISNNLVLSATVSNSSSVASVEYQLDGEPLYEVGEPVSPLTTPPYSYTYAGQYLYTGYKTLTAVARAADGTILGTSAPVTLRFSGTNSYTVKFSNFDPTVTQKGTLKWISTVDSAVAVWEHYCMIDGIAIPTRDSEISAELNLHDADNPGFNAVGITIDTTRFSNGKHQLYCAHVVPDGATNPWVSWSNTASYSTLVNFNNGHTPMALRSNQDVYLTVGQQAQLKPYIAYTDGTQDPPSTSGVTFTSDDPTVAIAGAGGTITAAAEGVTYVHLTNGSLVSQVHVTVDAVKAFPHFSKNSQIVNTYTPGSSVFMRSMFFLSPNDVISFPTYGSVLQQSGVNTLEGGIFYLSGRFTPTTTPTADYSTWFNNYTNNIINGDFAAAKKWNMAVFAAGDIAFRNIPQVYDYLHTPWTQQAWQTMLAGARDSHVFLGIDMIDETNYVLGNYPLPAGKVSASGAFTKIQVFGCPQLPCLGTGIVYYRYDSQNPGAIFNIQGSSVAALNGPHVVGGGKYWTSFTVAGGGINVPNHNVKQNGIPAIFSFGGNPPGPYYLPGGLSEKTIYYLIVVDANNLKVAATLSDALAGKAISITTPGSGAYVSWGMPNDGKPYASTACLAWTFTTQNVPNGVYDSTTDPNLQVVIWNTSDWFQYLYLGKKIGVDGPSKIVIASNVATATWSGHGLSNGQIIQIKNATNAALKAPYKVTVVDAQTISFSTMNVPDGTITPSTDPSLTVDVGYFPNWDNNVVKSILDVANQVSNRPPISWPIQGNSDNETAQRWLGDPRVSDYASLFQPGTDYPYDLGYRLYTLLRDVKPIIYGRLPYIQRHSAKTLIAHVGHAEYVKKTPGDHLNFGLDKLIAPSYRAERVAPAIMLAVESGMAGVRMYGYRPLAYGPSVVQPAGIGANIVQHVNPNVLGKKWTSMSNAFNFIQDLEPYILQPNISSPYLGPLVFTGAKEGNGGRLLMATSLSEVPQTVNIDFTPYLLGGAITRYRISYKGYTSTPIASGSGESVVLNPGDSVAYLFQ